MFSTGAWASNADGTTNTGLDDVDLWVGGLAEITNLIGGLLGSTFNYVFQTQLENLQDGDRLYYLDRTPGMNLRTQLEGNSFAELIQRNTDGTNTLKADAFATADCKFQLGEPRHGTPSAGFGDHRRRLVADDPTRRTATRTCCCCASRTARSSTASSTPSTRRASTASPSTTARAGVDRIFGGNDNDTFWGGDGNDVIEGNGGDDVALGGDGNDIITDLGGADVLKGGPGNDAIDAGIGDDIIMGGDGQDFIERRRQRQRDVRRPRQRLRHRRPGRRRRLRRRRRRLDPGRLRPGPAPGRPRRAVLRRPGARPQPGNDIFVGQVGENDYDAEGGDDLMAQNAAIDRNAGAGGFDWAIHQYDTVGADDDMEINNNLAGLPIQVVVNRDRWQETEADSGSTFNDVIKGDDDVAERPSAAAGFTGCDALDQAGVDRITGLNAIVPTSRRRLNGVGTARSSPRLGAGRLPARRATSGARATSCSAAAAATRSTAAAATTSSTATRRCTSGSASARPGRPGDRDRHAPTSWSTRRVTGTLRRRHGRHDAAAGRVRRPRRPGQPGHRRARSCTEPTDARARSTRPCSPARGRTTRSPRRRRQPHGRPTAPARTAPTRCATSRPCGSRTATCRSRRRPR